MAASLIYTFLPFCYHCGYVTIPLILQGFHPMLTLQIMHAVVPYRPFTLDRILSPTNLKSFTFSIMRTLYGIMRMIFTLILGIIHDKTLFRDQGYYWVRGKTRFLDEHVRFLCRNGGSGANLPGAAL
jgi:hypothetical protein